MPPTQALYYPWIDILDDGWLKTASLYWDELRTIVPESIDHPYSTDTGREFESEGFLIPLRVAPTMDEVEALTADAIAYLNTPEAAESVLSPRGQRPGKIHVDKLPRAFTELAMMHEDKLPLAVRELVALSGRGKTGRGGWLAVDEAFADFYMTLLATRLSDRIGASLLTPLPSSERLALTAKADAQLAGLLASAPRRHPREYEAWGPRRTRPHTLATGLLAQLTLEQVAVDPKTPVKKLIAFRQSHPDELAGFRTKVADLATQIETDLPADALRRRVQDIYVNQVQPALSDLQAALKGSRIKSFAEGIIKVALLSAGPSSILVNAGLSVPIALLAGAGASLAVTGVLYNVARRDSLRSNPYSYVLGARQELR